MDQAELLALFRACRAETDALLDGLAREFEAPEVREFLGYAVGAGRRFRAFLAKGQYDKAQKLVRAYVAAKRDDPHRARFAEVVFKISMVLKRENLPERTRKQLMQYIDREIDRIKKARKKPKPE